MDLLKLSAINAVLANYLPDGRLMEIQERLKRLPEDKLDILPTITQFKSPMTGLICSLAFGFLGLDRFYKGNSIRDTILGVMKLFAFVVGAILYIAADYKMINASYSFDYYNQIGNHIGFMPYIFSLLLWAGWWNWVSMDYFNVYEGIKKDNLNKLETTFTQFGV